MRSTCCIRMCSSTVGVPRRPLLPALHIGVETAPRSAPSSKCTPLARAVRRLSHKRVVVVAGGDVNVAGGGGYTISRTRGFPDSLCSQNFAVARLRERPRFGRVVIYRVHFRVNMVQPKRVSIYPSQFYVKLSSCTTLINLS